MEDTSTHICKMCQNESPCREQNCSKRQSKTCKNYSKNGDCRHKERCAYTHPENAQSQDIFNKAMLMLMLRQHEEIAALTEEVKGLEMMVQRTKDQNKEK